jgi:hypothetical protein
MYCTTKNAWIRSHWLTFACLIPFLAMLGVHRALHLSDALMVATPLSERPAHLYNLLMLPVFYASVVAYLVHALALARPSKGWLVFKLVFLAVCYTLLVVM